MKYALIGLIFTFTFFCSFINLKAQDDSLNMTVYYNDFIDTLTANYGGNYYSDCWGFSHEQNDYAVIASTAGVHFYDVTDPVNSYHCAFAAGELQGYYANWRDYHNYQNYLYTVSDVYGGSLQIIDYSDLPNSVDMVYDSQDLIKESHNIFIDTANAILYACGGDRLNNTSFDLALYDISDPISPVLLLDYNDVGYIHDCYVRDGIAYLEAPNNSTLYVVDFNDLNNITILGSKDNYTDAGYTHSGWLSDDGNYYILMDETAGSQIKMLDVSDLTDIQEIDVFGSYTAPISMAHNVIIKDNFAYVSYYNDGVHIFDISDPYDVVSAGYYDSYSLPDTVNYKGVWGVYPFGNGKVIASDRHRGLFVFDANAALNYNVDPPSANFNYTYNYETGALELEDSSLNDPNTWYWDFGDGNTSSEQNPEYFFADSLAGSFLDVCLTLINYAGESTYCETIEVIIPPIALFNFDLILDYSDYTYEIAFSDMSSYFPDNWYWDFGDSITSTLQEPVHQYNESLTGSFVEVCLTVSNDAGLNSYCENIELFALVGLEEFGLNKISIFPNPATDLLKIKSELNINLVKVFDASMHLIFSSKMEEVIDISNLSEGIYYLQAMADNGSIIKRFVKTN